MNCLRALALALLFAPPAAAQPGSGSWSFQGRVYDGGTGPARQAMVVVSEGRIVCFDAPGECAVPEGARRIEAADATLMPGLVDLHTHARPHYAALWVEAGVTSIRDGNNSLAVLDEIRANQPLAPRVFGSGPLLDGPESVLAGMSEKAGPPDAFPVREQQLMMVATPEEAERAVDLLADNGAQHIKLYEQLPLPVYRAAAARARARGLPVMTDLGMATTRGLSHAEVDALQAAEAGATSLEHLGGVALAYRRLGGDPLADTFDEALLDRIAVALVEAGVAVVPTLVGASNMASEEYPDAGDYPLAERLHPDMLAWWRGLHSGHGAENRQEYQREYRFRKAFLGRFIEHGGVIGAGSDTPALPMVVAGDSLHVEMRALQSLGLTAPQALHAATGAAARIAGRDEIGRIAVGKRADIVLVDGDPTRQLSDSRRVRAVWQDGVLRFGEP